MTTDFENIGVMFKEKRQELGLSVKEIENSTSIRSSYIEAIEAGKTKSLLTDVYLNGFMRQYASFLGLNVEELEKQFPQAFNLSNQKHDFEYGIGTLEMRGSIGGGVKWLPNLLWAGLSAVVLVLAWLFMKYLNLM